MLAILPNINGICAENRQCRIYSLIRPPLFQTSPFSDGGQGPEKPIIFEEVEVEEEIFTFPYPAEQGEISDLINPPVAGIAGEVMRTQSKVAETSISRGSSSNIFSYIFLTPVREPIRAAEPEFVSLTRQSEIAGSYVSLLVYVSYSASNAHFSYTSGGVYEKPSLTGNTKYYGSNKPFYETRFSMPMFSESVDYGGKARDKIDVNPLTQPSLQSYQSVLQETIDIEPLKLYADDLPHQEFGVNPDLNVDAKLDYKTPGLELHVANTNLELGVNPDYKVLELKLFLAKTELPVLDANSKVGETQPIVSFLFGLSCPEEDLTVNVTRPRLDAAPVPKYDTKTQVKYEAKRGTVQLPVNLGFDDPLLGDRFIARLNAPAIEVEHQSITLGNQAINSDSRVPAETYTTTRDEVIIQEAALPKFTDFSFFPIRLVLDLGNNMNYVLDRENTRHHELQSPVLSDNNALDMINVGYRVSEKDDDKPITPQPGYDFAQLGFTLDQPMMRQIAHVGVLTAVEYQPPLMRFDDPLLIKIIIPSSHDAPQTYTIISHAAKRGEVQVEPIRNTTANAEYGAMPLGFDLEIPDNPIIAYNRARVTLDPYSLFTLGNTRVEPNYQNQGVVRTLLLPNTEYRTNLRTDLDNLVRVNYDGGRVNSLPTTNTFSTNHVLVPFHLDTQQDTTTTTVNNLGYLGISPEKDLEEVIEQEEMAEEEKTIEMGVRDQTNAEVHDGDKAETKVYEKSESKQQQETETNESGDSSVNDLALAAGAIGLSVLGGAASLVGALFKKNYEKETPSDKPEDVSHKPEKGASSKNCKDTSQCFADTIDWLEGKLENPTLTKEEYESISQCYAEEIKNIQKAREYIKKREGGYSCGGALHNLFHHVGFTEEQERKYRLRDYVRDGKVEEWFKLATTIIAEENLEGSYNIEAIWVDDQKGGQSERTALKKSSAYAQLDIGLRKQGYTPVWKIMSYIDTDTGEKRSGLYLETIAELHFEGKELLGDRDEYGMMLMGIILLVNGQEPGRGTASMHDYDVMSGDRIDVLFKNDSARHSDNRQSIPNKKIKEGFGDYSEKEKTSEKMLEPVLV